MESVAARCLLLLAALLPFELNRPQLTLGPVAITTVEALVYATLLAWAGAGGLRRTFAAPTLAHAAVLLWMAAIAISSLAGAPVAVKAGLRGLAGSALFFVAADLASDHARAWSLLVAACAGAALSAGTAVAEAFLPGAAAALAPFRSVAASAHGLPRASGTFPYPTIAAMYWEAALPMVLACAARAKRAQVLFVVSGFVVIEAILLTGSRAGLSLCLWVLVTAALVGRRVCRDLTGPALSLLIGFAVLLALDFATRPLIRARFATMGDEVWYRADYVPDAAFLDVRAGEEVRLGLTVTNRGTLPWLLAGHLALGYEWHALETPSVLAGPPMPFPVTVEPGAQTHLEVSVRAPAEPGRYALRWCLLTRGAAWESTRTPSGEIQARVLSSPSSSGRQVLAAAAFPTQRQPTRSELWRAGLRMWRERPLVGLGPDRFRTEYGRYLGVLRFDPRLRANSLYVETLAELGTIGLLALIALGVTFALAVRATWRSPHRLLALASGTALAAYALHGLLDSFLSFTPTYGLFWIAAGICAAPRPGPLPPATPAPTRATA